MEKQAGSIGRREFTRQTALGLLSGVTITISGCGGGGGGSGGGGNPTGPGNANNEYGVGGPTDPGGGAVASVSGNHGHRAVIAQAELQAAGGVTLNIQGSATHPHEVQLTDAEVVAVAGGQRVAKTSSAGDGHAHTVTFNP
jgi:hypothetical protein